MVPDTNAPPAPPQDPTNNTASPGLAWSWVRSLPIETHLDGKPVDFFNVFKPRRERRKQPARSPDGYLTRPEAAVFLGVSLRWLEANTTIPKHNLAGPRAKKAMWRYSKGDLEMWIAARTNSGKSGRA